MAPTGVVVAVLRYRANLFASTVGTAGVYVVPSRGAVCVVVASRDRVFRLELTFLQVRTYLVQYTTTHHNNLVHFVHALVIVCTDGSRCYIHAVSAL